IVSSLSTGSFGDKATVKCAVGFSFFDTTRSKKRTGEETAVVQCRSTFSPSSSNSKAGEDEQQDQDVTASI
ncbi:unnamed protein product, partial [Amoebophrya sp. A25]